VGGGGELTASESEPSQQRSQRKMMILPRADCMMQAMAGRGAEGGGSSGDGGGGGAKPNGRPAAPRTSGMKLACVTAGNGCRHERTTGLVFLSPLRRRATAGSSFLAVASETRPRLFDEDVPACRKVLLTGLAAARWAMFARRLGDIKARAPRSWNKSRTRANGE